MGESLVEEVGINHLEPLMRCAVALEGANRSEAFGQKVTEKRPSGVLGLAVARRCELRTLEHHVLIINRLNSRAAQV